MDYSLNLVQPERETVIKSIIKLIFVKQLTKRKEEEIMKEIIP